MPEHLAVVPPVDRVDVDGVARCHANTLVEADQREVLADGESTGVEQDVAAVTVPPLGLGGDGGVTVDPLDGGVAAKGGVAPAY